MSINISKMLKCECYKYLINGRGHASQISVVRGRGPARPPPRLIPVACEGRDLDRCPSGTDAAPPPDDPPFELGTVRWIRLCGI